MPESEETRVTDAEVEAAAWALPGVVIEGYERFGTPAEKHAAYVRLARAALEAAAALHPPREGAAGDEHEHERVNIGDFARWLCDRQGFSIDDETDDEREKWMWEADAVICEVLRRADAITRIAELLKTADKLLATFANYGEMLEARNLLTEALAIASFGGSP